MLGIFRFFLVFCIITYHLTPFTGNLGVFAVISFYVITGYLITLNLHETYHFQFTPFIKNRFLRLYPAYYACALFTIIIFSFTAKQANPLIFHPSWTSTYRTGDILGNTLLLPWAFLSDKVVPVTMQTNLNPIAYFRLVPSTWFVGIELLCYIILFVFTSRNFRNSILTILFAIGWHLFISLSHMDSRLHYFPVSAALLPIGFGSLVYYVKNRLKIQMMEHVRIFLGWTVPLMFFFNWYNQYTSRVPIFDSANLYIAILIGCFACLAYGTYRYCGFWGKLDKLFGDLSYPLFLGHYITAFLGWIILGTTTQTRGWDIVFMGSFINLILCLLYVYFIDHRISHLRGKIRTGIRITTQK